MSNRPTSNLGIPNGAPILNRSAERVFFGATTERFGMLGGIYSAREALLFSVASWVVLLRFPEIQRPGAILALILALHALTVGLTWASRANDRISSLADRLEQNRQGIQQHRDDERNRLLAIYLAKGLSEPLASQTVDVLTADDDLFLRALMVEEVQPSTDHYPHPLVVGACYGISATASSFMFLGAAFSAPPRIAAVVGFGTCVVLLGLLAMLEKVIAGQGGRRAFLQSLFWAAIVVGSSHFLTGWALAATQ